MTPRYRCGNCKRLIRSGCEVMDAVRGVLCRGCARLFNGGRR